MLSRVLDASVARTEAGGWRAGRGGWRGYAFEAAAPQKYNCTIVIMMSVLFAPLRHVRRISARPPIGRRTRPYDPAARPHRAQPALVVAYLFLSPLDARSMGYRARRRAMTAQCHGAASDPCLASHEPAIPRATSAPTQHQVISHHLANFSLSKSSSPQVEPSATHSSGGLIGVPLCDGAGRSPNACSVR